MKKTLMVFLTVIVIGFICVSCSQQDAKPKDGNVTIQFFNYVTESAGIFLDYESLGIEHFEVNGMVFSSLPFTLYNLPGNQYYDYAINAYDAEGTLMASCRGQFAVVEDFTITQTATLIVRHQHKFRDEWSNDKTYHWHGTSCGHSPTKDKAQHTFDGDVCTVCGYDKHVHTYSSQWSTNVFSHWHEATCGHNSIVDFDAHTFGPDIIDTEPTCAENGEGHHICTICGETVTYSIKATGEHTLNDNQVCTVCGLHGPTGLYIFFDKGSYSDGWRYLGAAPSDLKVIDGVPTVDPSFNGYWATRFGYYRTSDSGSNLFVNGTTSYNSSDCTGTAIGTGKMNTQMLVSAMGTEAYIDGSGSVKSDDYAAKLCNILTYTVNGVTYDDWFLPSKDELNLMYENLKEKGLGRFASDCYCTSSEVESIYATNSWCQSFNNGTQIEYCPRYLSYGVRPIRAF